MFPYPFTYLAPSDISEAVEMLVRYEEGEAKVLAGGQSLIPLMKLRFAAPQYLVDLGRVPGLDGIEEDGEGLRIGTLTRERELERSPAVARRYPALLDTALVIADPVVRNLATVGGNLAHGDPANDHPATMVALRASVVAEGPEGRRVVPVEALFEGLYETSLAPSEVLREIRVPAPAPGEGAAYEKYERQVGDFAVVGAAAALRAADGVVAKARVALTNVGPTPHRAREAEVGLEGQSASEETFRAAAQAAAEGLVVYDDLRGSAQYKRRVAVAVTLRALRRAWGRARENAT